MKKYELTSESIRFLGKIKPPPTSNRLYIYYHANSIISFGMPPFLAYQKGGEMNKEKSNQIRKYDCLERQYINKGRIFGMHLAGRTNLEIARKLGIPLQTVKMCIKQMEQEVKRAERTI